MKEGDIKDGVKEESGYSLWRRSEIAEHNFIIDNRVKVQAR